MKNSLRTFTLLLLTVIVIDISGQSNEKVKKVSMDTIVRVSPDTVQLDEIIKKQKEILNALKSKEP